MNINNYLTTSHSEKSYTYQEYDFNSGCKAEVISYPNNICTIRVQDDLGNEIISRRNISSQRTNRILKEVARV